MDAHSELPRKRRGAELTWLPKVELPLAALANWTRLILQGERRRCRLRVVDNQRLQPHEDVMDLTACVGPAVTKHRHRSRARESGDHVAHTRTVEQLARLRRSTHGDMEQQQSAERRKGETGSWARQRGAGLLKARAATTIETGAAFWW